MNHADMVIGKRYQLPHGTGVLLGHETFDREGFCAPRVHKVNPDQTVRHIFLLDEGHTWKSAYKKDSSEPIEYCAWGKDIVEIE